MSKRQTRCKLVAQVGARIRFLRLERGWSLRTLGKKAQCSHSNLHAIETGQSAICIDTFRKIARALRVKPFDLLNHDPDGNDVTYIAEKMRQDPETAVLVKAWLRSGAMAAGDCLPCTSPV